MVNYLTRHASPVPVWNGIMPEKAYVEQLQSNPPDYVVLISRDLSEFADQRYGVEGGPGHEIIKWVLANYRLEKRTGGDPFNPAGPKGVMILRRK